MALGMWTGFREAQVEGAKNRRQNKADELEEARYQQGRDDRAAEIAAKEFNTARNALLPMIMETHGKRKTNRDSTIAQIKTLEGYNLRPDVARALVKSGQASTIIDTAKKDGGFLRTGFINQLSSAVEREYKAEDAETRAKLIMDGYNAAGNDMSDGNQYASILGVLYKTKTMEELSTYMGGLDLTVPNFIGSGDSININFAEGNPLAQGTINAIQRNTNERMASILGAGVKFMGGSTAGDPGSLEYTTSAFGEDQSQAIVGKVAEVVAKIQQVSPNILFNQNEIFDKVSTLVKGGYAGVDILSYLNNGIRYNNATGEISFATLTGQTANPGIAAPAPDGSPSGPREPIIGFSGLLQTEMDSIFAEQNGD